MIQKEKYFGSGMSWPESGPLSNITYLQSQRVAVQVYKSAISQEV